MIVCVCVMVIVVMVMGYGGDIEGGSDDIVGVKRGWGLLYFTLKRRRGERERGRNCVSEKRENIKCKRVKGTCKREGMELME